MSYEGHTKILCKNGHLSIFDTYTEICISEFNCVCGAKAVWYTNVDETNGDNETTGMCPGDVKLKIRKKNECKCPKCKKIHRSDMVQYYIPKKGGHQI